MKRVFLSFLVSFALLIISNLESKGQYTCASGFTMVTHTVPGGNGCDYLVEICVKCVPTHPGEIDLHPWRIRAHPDNPNCGISDEVIDYIYQHVSSAHFIFTYLCTWTTAPPCKPEPPETEVDTLIVTVDNYFCYFEFKDYEYYQGDTVIVDAVEPCYRDRYCEVKIRYCMRTDLNPPEFISEVVSAEIMPAPLGIPWKECPLYGYHNFGECFMRITECHP